MHRQIKIAPSILAGNFGRLEDEARKAEVAGADILHVDIMDGHFVPNITIGPQTVSALRKITKLPLDVHLMISEPQKYVDEFIKAGADNLTVHLEVGGDIAAVIHQIKSQKIRCGVALKPGTAFKVVIPYLGEIDLLLLMTVEPGFGGQSFIPEVIPKIEESRKWLDREGCSFDIEVDGGINLKTAPSVIQAGANVLVAGSAIYKADDIVKAVHQMRDLAKGILTPIKSFHDPR